MVNAALDKEKFDELQKYIDELQGQKGMLMPVMQKAQEIFGYLPIEVQNFIAENLGISLSEVFGVATFYAQFAIEPKGKHLVGVCLGTACYVKNSEGILSRLCDELNVKPGTTTKDGKFTLEPTRCLGCCSLAPVMMIDDQVFGRLTVDKVPEILKKFN
ncbi:MAG: NADH-quinone oxidoreductase subunit NuoE [Eubacteriales bacterium]